MKFGKTDLIRRINDVVRNGWSNVHIRDLIESLWRDPYSMRTSGFVKEGGTDSLIAAEVTSTVVEGVTLYAIVFQITPKGKKFDFYQFREILTYHKKYASEVISFDAEEGLHVVYYDFDPDTFEQVLMHIHNPTHDDLLEMMEWVVPITFLYYDAEKHEIIYFGDNRHGSWWNPWIHFAWHQTFNSMRESGLEFTDLIADGDGSSDTHAQFGVSEGTCFHEDIYATVGTQAAPADFPVWYFKAGNLPRIHETSVNSLVIDGLLCYNSGGATVPATEGYFVMYHIFFTNDILEPFISVMGQAQYAKVSTASLMVSSEVTQVKDLLPHQNLLHIGTLLFQTSSLYGNTPKSRIVTQAFGVITRWSVEGDGSAATPVQLKNDEETPTPGKIYSAHYLTGEKGYHLIDPRLFGWGQAIYLHDEDSDLSGFKKALPIEPDAAEESYTASGTSADGEILVKKLVTDPGYPGVTQIKAGPWMFDLWAAVSTDRNCSMKVYVYKRTSGGTETELFNYTQAVTAVGISQHFYAATQNAIPMLVTDRLAVYIYFINPTITNTTFYLGVEGETWWSNFRIPLPVEVQNDQLQADWEQTDTEAPDFIKNKPTIPEDTDNYTEDMHFDPVTRDLTLERTGVLTDLVANIPCCDPIGVIQGAVTNVKYGHLYNFPAVVDARNITPAGWHIPTRAEFVTLMLYLDPDGTGDTNTAGGPLKEIGLIHWNNPNTNADNSTMFNGRGAGSRLYNTGVFTYLKATLYLWNSEAASGTTAYVSYLEYWTGVLTTSQPSEYIGVTDAKKAGNSLRYIKDDSTNPGTVTGNDGKVYPTVKIGNQVWMACNSAETKYRNGDAITGPTFTNAAWAALTTEAYCIYDDNPDNAIDGFAIKHNDTSEKQGGDEALDEFFHLSKDEYDRQQPDWEQTDDTKADYIKNKPSIPEIPVDIDPQNFDFPDVETGVSQTYPLFPYVPYSGVIKYLAVKADATMDDLTIEINGNPVVWTGSAVSIDVTTGYVKTLAIDDYAVVEGDEITMVTSGTDGGATRITGTLLIEKS